MDNDSLFMAPQQLQRLSHTQRERLAYIDFRLYFMGEVGRPDLASHFGMAPAAATRDLALYREVASQNIEFDGSNKIYRIGKAFIPLFDHNMQRVLSALSHGFCDVVHGNSKPMLACEFPVELCNPRIDVLAPICRAIHLKRPVLIRYYSMSNGETERIIVPFALVDTGLRCHIRAFDRKTGNFRDFVITRIVVLTLLDEEPKANELPSNDSQWIRIIELDLVPHPRLARPEIIRMDYGMVDGLIRMRVRAAVAGYMLLRWGVDASPDHSLKEEQYRLWLSNSLALKDVDNAKLVPGYRFTKLRT